jgi:hypothetical protein
MCFYNYSNSSSSSDSFHYEHHLSDKKNITTNSSQILIEENSNENETSSDFEFQSALLPFLISCLNFDTYEMSIPSVTSLTDKHINPIYLSVCNFRI